MKRCMLLAVAAFLCFHSVVGQCFLDKPHVKILGANGGMKGKVTYCLYKKAEILVGSSFKTSDCLSCTCSESGLSCCGFGPSLPIGLPPQSRCVRRNNNCEVEWVRRRNPKRKCRGPRG